MRISVRSVALLLLILLASRALADERLGSFLIADDIDDAIFLVDKITIDSPYHFQRAMLKRPNATTLILSSPGGVVYSGLIIAQLVRDEGLNTYVPEDYGCYSACAYIFLAGRSRLAEGELGVHQVASDIQDNSGTQLTIADVIEVLVEIETPSEVIVTMLKTPDSEMYVFTDTELDELGINRDVAALGGETSAPASPSEVPSSTRLALYEGVDFYGSDIPGMGHSSDAVQCSHTCLGNGQCTAFTFNVSTVNSDYPNCFTKTSVGELRANSNALSGVLLAPNDDPPSFAFSGIDPHKDLYFGVNYPGFNMASSADAANANSLDDCIAVCLRNDRCAAFSYQSSSRQCLIKSQVGRAVDQPGYTSGIKRSIEAEPIEILSLEQ